MAVCIFYSEFYSLKKKKNKLKMLSKKKLKLKKKHSNLYQSNKKSWFISTNKISCFKYSIVLIKIENKMFFNK